MGQSRRRTSSPDAGGATGSSRSVSRGRGQSGADGVRPRTSGDLLEALDGLADGSPAYGPRCAVEGLMASLDPEVAARVGKALDEKLPNGQWVAVSRIANLLTEYGYPNLYRSLSRHRRRKTSPALGCRCP